MLLFILCITSLLHRALPQLGLQKSARTAKHRTGVHLLGEITSVVLYVTEVSVQLVELLSIISVVSIFGRVKDVKLPYIPTETM